MPTQEIPTTLKALLIVHPETPLSETELRYIDQYVMRGGSLAVFGGGDQGRHGQSAAGHAADRPSRSTPA